MIKDRATAALYPLTSMQLGMLFQYLSNKNSGEYVQQVVIDLNERFDEELFLEAVSRIVMRYEVFRIGFNWEKGDEPSQSVQEITSIPINKFNLASVSTGNQQAEIEKYLAHDREQGFDLSTAPLNRFTLFRLGEEKFKLIWSYHHIILDGRSRFIVTKELFEIYDALREGKKIALYPVVGFSDYVNWIKAQDFSDGIAYYKKLLEGVSSPASLNALTSPGGGLAKPSEAGLYQLRVDSVTTQRLRQIARKIDVSLGNVVQAAWAVLLGKYTNEERIVFGAVRDCRKGQFEGINRVVGMVMNNLPIVVGLEGAPKLTDLLKEIRGQQLGQRSFDHTPLNEVQRQTNFSKNLRIFETYMVFDFKETITALRSMDPKWLQRGYELIEKSNYPLHISTFAENELLVRFFFDLNQFNQPAVIKVGRQFETLLKEFADSDDRPIWSYGVLSNEDKRQILEDWNSTQRSYDLNQTLMDMFEKQVERSPDDTALIVGDIQLTYQELNERTNRLGRYLSRWKVGPESLVGLFLERSVEMVLGIYGVLKAGGAYVPLDPEYPLERLEFMIEDTQVAVILAQQHLKDRLPKTNASVVFIDAEWDEIEKEEGSNFDNGSVSTNAAYVIFTSGSTGKPKGVVNEHRGIVNRLIWMQEEYKLTKDEHVLQKTPFSFDVSVWEFFWPLQVGAKLVVAKPGGHKDSAYLAELIRRHSITTIHFVPSMLQIFLEEKQVDQCESLRRVICSGEALTHELERRFFERFQKAELHNLYGPTEAAVDVTYWACQRDCERLVVPIGRPVANTQMYILDRRMAPVPVGVTGELYIGGVQVARGYLNRAELTAERFVPDPFSCIPGAKLYRTGDLAKYLPDGVIEYLGRADFQIKIRGMRVELGEIEARLEQYENIGQCAVMLREDIPGDQRLVAYYVPRNCTELNVAELREWMRETLPDFMVPQHFFSIERMPLTASGKVDRRALPKPLQRSLTDTNYMAPRNQTEEVISGVWKELLGLERVGIHDNFFDLGGHSLLVIRMVGLLKDHFAKPIGVVDIFEHPTVERLGAFFAMAMREGDTNIRAQAFSLGSKQRAALQKTRQRFGRDLGRKRVS